MIFGPPPPPIDFVHASHIQHMDKVQGPKYILNEK